MIFWKLRKRPFKWCVAIQNFVGALICHFSALDHGLLFMVSPNWQILLSLKYDFWWHHLNYFFLSFQKKKTFQMMCCNPKFCRGPNLSFFGLGPWAIIHGIAKLANTFISQIWFLMTPFERYLDTFQMMCFNPKFNRGPNLSFFGLGPWAMVSPNWQILLSLKYELWWYHLKGIRYFLNEVFSNPKFRRGHNLSFFGLGPWAIIHGIAKLANTFISQIWILMTPFERSLSKLSENHKIFDIGSSVYPMSTILWFSESLEKYLSNGVIKVHI